MARAIRRSNGTRVWRPAPDELGSILTLDGAGVLAGPANDDALPTFHGMVGQSDAMRILRAQLERVAATRMAATRVAVLLTGAIGSGKALAARAMHELSGRRSGPFVSVNCSSMPPEALESALFGTSDGGLIESAQGGTLLLDQIGDLTAVAQARLSWLLEHGEIVRAGGVATRVDDVRVVASSHSALDQRVRDGRFHEALLYRLRVMTVHVPALRERMDDLPYLIEHFVRTLSARYALPRRTFNHSATLLLRRHDWPGNVRELRDVIESALLLADGPMMTPRELPPVLNAYVGAANRDVHTSTEQTLAEQTSLTFVEARERMLREFDRAFLRAALERHGGNVARTARSLGLHRQSLQKLLVRRELRLPNDGLQMS